MPSPFPGMDPYIEGTDWSSFHTHFAVEIARQLMPLLRPKYFVRSEKRYVISASEPEEAVVVSAAQRVPDIAITHAGDESTGGTLVATEPPALQLATVMPESLPQVTVEIRDAAQRLLVTAIEVLSPFNKRSNGREEYLARRNRVLLSATHLMEIDLLRRGERVPMVRPLPDAPYFVILSRLEKRPLSDVWPIGFRAPLPMVKVPLLPGDPDVALDLQAVFSSVYDGFGYDLDLSYSQPPATPLPADQLDWANQRVARRDL